MAEDVTQFGGVSYYSYSSSVNVLNEVNRLKREVRLGTIEAHNS
jgi:hypothetical protein